MPARKPATPLCDQFGFDAAWRDAQLRLVGLTRFSRDDVRQLHKRVLDKDTATTIIERFYDSVRQNAQAEEILSSFDIAQLRRRQVDYLAGFGNRFRDAVYFESRASLGVTHARVGVPLSLYVAAVGLLQSLILAEVQARIDAREPRQLLTDLVVKLASLDIALATEVYHRSRIAGLDRSVRHLEQQRLRLYEQLEHDALTGVSSRTSLLEALEMAAGRAAKTGQPLVVVMADLDHFKAINDSHGHLAGDQVLRDVAARLKAALREFDLVGRFGGEEFVILLENTSLHTARQVAERVRRRISATPVKTDTATIDVTVSQGLALYRPGEDASLLLKRADEAMYRAKDAGRDCVRED